MVAALSAVEADGDGQPTLDGFHNNALLDAPQRVRFLEDVGVLRRVPARGASALLRAVDEPTAAAAGIRLQHAVNGLDRNPRYTSEAGKC